MILGNKNKILSITFATIWISVSEFFRNEFLCKSIWLDHFSSLGLIFPSKPINGILWGFWSLGLAISIFLISQRLKFLHTFFFIWFVGFVLMWIVTWNLGILPIAILAYAIPLSLFELYLATWIIYKFK